MGHLPTPQMALINYIEEPWFRVEARHKYPNWIMCDQLAVLVAIEPELITEAKLMQVLKVITGGTVNTK